MGNFRREGNTAVSKEQQIRARGELTAGAQDFQTQSRSDHVGGE